MRSLICRFKDEAELDAHLDGDHGLRFLSELDLGLGGQVELAVVVADSRQRARFSSIVIERTTMCVDVGERGSRTVWIYRAQVEPADRVWLDAFVARVSTAGIQFAA